MRQGNENFNKNKKMNSEVKFADLLADESINENTNHKSANNNMRDNMINPDFSNISKNAPCPCGSGKKFKMCCSSAPLQSELKKQQDEERKLREREIHLQKTKEQMKSKEEIIQRWKIRKANLEKTLEGRIFLNIDKDPFSGTSKSKDSEITGWKITKTTRVNSNYVADTCNWENPFVNQKDIERIAFNFCLKISQKFPQILSDHAKGKDLGNTFQMYQQDMWHFVDFLQSKIEESEFSKSEIYMKLFNEIFDSVNEVSFFITDQQWVRRARAFGAVTRHILSLTLGKVA